MQCPEETWLFPETTQIRELKRYNHGKLSASSRRPRASGGTFCFERCEVARRSHFERWPKGPRNTLCRSAGLHGSTQPSFHRERVDKRVHGANPGSNHTAEER